MAPKVFVHTLGDLDNVYALLNNRGTNLDAAQISSVEGQLQRQLNTQASQEWSYQVVSHSFQGFNGTSVLKGGDIGKSFPPEDPKTKAYIQGKLGSSIPTFVRPLDLLSEHVSKNPDDHHFVVISFGRNDLRENPGQPLELLLKISQIQAHYSAILNQIQSLPTPIKPILVFQYLTNPHQDPLYRDLAYLASRATAVYLAYLGAISFISLLTYANKISLTAGFYSLLLTVFAFVLTDQIVPLRMSYKIVQCQRPRVALMKVLMENLYRPLLRRAQIQNIPVVDLTHTFNPYQHELYASGTEPSITGGARIAKAICRVLQDEGQLPHIYTDKSSSPYIPSKWKV